MKDLHDKVEAELIAKKTEDYMNNGIIICLLYFPSFAGLARTSE